MPRHTIEPKYQKTIIKEYEHWTLLLHDNPGPYLGRAVVWLARAGGMQRFSDLAPHESLELTRILKEYEHALHAVWKPDHMNYAWLGNLFHEHGGHGHMHVIPRYAVVREFLGAEFKDERYGDNYVPYQKRPLFGIQIREMIELLRTMMPK